MVVKITNCTVFRNKYTNRIRKNQNVQIALSDDWFDDETPEEFLKRMRYREHGFKSFNRSPFIVTNSSKIILKNR